MADDTRSKPPMMPAHPKSYISQTPLQLGRSHVTDSGQRDVDRSDISHLKGP